MTSVARMQAVGSGSMVLEEYRQPHIFGAKQTYGPLEAPAGVDLSEWALAPFVGMTQQETSRELLYEGMEPDAFADMRRAEQAHMWGRIGGVRATRGIRQPVFSVQQVAELRDRYARGGLTYRELARQNNVSIMTIRRALRGFDAYDEVS